MYLTQNISLSCPVGEDKEEREINLHLPRLEDKIWSKNNTAFENKINPNQISFKKELASLFT